MEYRIEHDVLGEVKVPAAACWMSQTQRSLENFKIGTEKMPPMIISCFAWLKMACAIANEQCHKISTEQKDAIVEICREILAGKWRDQFPLAIWQTGSGTQTNMNVNEVISRLCHLRWPDLNIHPNDTVNASQSSNDTFPTVLHMAVCIGIRKELLPALDEAIEALKDIEAANPDLIKIGRTHLQDAVPLRFASEVSGWRSGLEHAKAYLEQALPFMQELAIGATAVGTCLNASEGFGKQVCALLDSMTGVHFKSDPNFFHALSMRDSAVLISGALKALAADCMKMANDVRWLASGPRCGLSEIVIPANEPGSSIMPGKVNPTQCEALTMVAVQVMGNDAAVGFAASQGNFELNVFLPVIAYNLLQSITLLKDAIHSFTIHCLHGLKPDEARIKANVQNSLMLVTCLNPVIGYENAGKAARYAFENNLSLKQAVLALGLLEEEQFDRLVDPARMV